MHTSDQRANNTTTSKDTHKSYDRNFYRNRLWYDVMKIVPYSVYILYRRLFPEIEGFQRWFQNSTYSYTVGYRSTFWRISPSSIASEKWPLASRSRASRLNSGYAKLVKSRIVWPSSWRVSRGWRRLVLSSSIYRPSRLTSCRHRNGIDNQPTGFSHRIYQEWHRDEFQSFCVDPPIQLNDYSRRMLDCDGIPVECRLVAFL